MGEQAQALANRLEQVNNTLIATVEQCSEADWNKHSTNDARPMGVIVHHLASTHEAVLDMAQGVAAGQPLPDLTWEMVHAGNAADATQCAGCTKAETLDLLRRNSAEAVRAIREVSDEQLARTSTWDLDGAVTTQQVIELHMIDHVQEHLATLQTAMHAG